jgi:hypothetical protein
VSFLVIYLTLGKVDFAVLQLASYGETVSRSFWKNEAGKCLERVHLKGFT